MRRRFVPIARMTEEERRAAIEKLMAGPKSVTVDNETVTQMSADELIKLDQYLAGKEMKPSGATGFRFLKFIPPGTG
jgi:hypothetical protein